MQYFVNIFFTVYRGETKGSETFLTLINLNFVRKRLILHENITPVFLTDDKMLLLTAKLEKTCLVYNFF